MSVAMLEEWKAQQASRRAENEARDGRIGEVKELRRGYAAKHILISTEVLDDLLKVYDAVAILEPGDVITWGCGAVAARVITCDRYGLSYEYANGQREFFQGLKRPSGLVKLPEGTPVGPLPERGVA